MEEQLLEFETAEKWKEYLDLIKQDKSLIDKVDFSYLLHLRLNYELHDKSKIDEILVVIEYCKNIGLKPENIPQATILNDKDEIKNLLLKGNGIDEIDYWGRTALVIATILNNTELVKFILDNNASVHCDDNEHLTAIDYSQSEKISELLRAEGAQTKKERNEAMDDYYSAVEFSNDFRDVQIQFMTGAANNKIEQMQEALNRPKGIWVLNCSYPINGKSALHLAVESKSITAVEFLLLKGINKNIKDHKGETPLDIAKRLMCEDIIIILQHE